MKNNFPARGWSASGGKPISISLSPNVQKDDIKLALQLIIRPWLWTLRRQGSSGQEQGKGVVELEEEFKKYVGVKHAISFNSGRSSLYAILTALNLEKGSQVALQAFTCNAVPNPILWANLEPLYIDCNTDDYNLNLSDLESKIGPRTRAVVVQHTFGLPANIGPIMAFCEANNLILIEDCAHALGAEFSGKKVGTFGKASFFSFSRDKVISSVYGGMVATNDSSLAEKIRRIQGEFGMPTRFWIFQQLLHPILLYYLILPIYAFLDLGKIFLVMSQVFHVLSKAVSWQEKQGKKPDYFPKALPSALAMIALHQLKKVDMFNGHRQDIADFYYQHLKDTGFELPKEFSNVFSNTFSNRKNIFLRFTLQHPKAHDILYQAWHQQNILLGDWYTTPIAPFDTNMEAMKYQAGLCKNAEALAKITLNLPTHINIGKKEADRIITFLKSAPWN